MAGAHKRANGPAPSEEAFIAQVVIVNAAGDRERLRANVRAANSLHLVRALPPLVAAVVFVAIGMVAWALAPGHGSIPPWYSLVSLLLSGGSGTVAGVLMSRARGRGKADPSD
jgi:hypothetical protein